MGENHPAADLGRYTHRVAIANSRLVGLTEGRVSFRWKDYRHHDKQQREIVDARGCGNRGAAGSYLKQNYEMLAERARGLLSGEVSRPDEHETRRHTI
jgi:hypothetical protein